MKIPKENEVSKPQKTMLPCRRGALLAKAASFKKIPENIQIKHEIDAKNIPQIIKNN